MATVNLEDFLDHVLAEVRLAPEDLAIQKMREVVRDFCQFTRVWQVDGVPITIVAGTPEYQVSSGDESEPVMIEWLSVDDVAATPKNVEWFDRFFSSWRTTIADDYRFFAQRTRNTFIFNSIPLTNGTANGVTYRLSVKPGPLSVEVDEDVWNNWYETICVGTKARLLTMEGERWAQMKRGIGYSGQYIHEKNRARAQIWRGYGKVNEVWVGPKFGGR